MRRTPAFVRSLLLITATWGAGATSDRALAQPLSTSFTYQGQLKNAGSPANGLYDLRFRLYDAALGGAQVGSTLCINNATIVDGIFTVPLDFGAQFAGQQRFLEIDVRADTGLTCANSTGFTTLSQRQLLTSAPNALFAQTVGVPLTLSGTNASSYIIRGENNSTGPGSVGISGGSTALSGQTFGVLGQCQSTDGSGVVGVVSSGTGENFGVWGRSDSTSGRGVFGQTRAITGSTYGVYGESASTSGRGVLGWATATSGVNYGVSARSDSSSGRGLFAYAASSAGISYGVFAQSDSPSGTGVYGEGGDVGVSGLGNVGVSGSGDSYGVHGICSGLGGRGVVGVAANGTGVSYGVHGTTLSSSENTAGVFGASFNPSGVTFGGRFENYSTTGIGVFGWGAAATGLNYGLYGRSDSASGVGVLGLTLSPLGQAVVGHSSATTGPGNGVIGWCDSASGFDFNAIGAGINYGSTSSRRWKTDIEPIEEPLEKLSRLRGVYFNWDAKHGGQHDVGMIAEEVGEVLPEIVGYEENGVDAIAMDYSKMAPLLVQAVNALRSEKDAEITALRAEKDAQLFKQQQQLDVLTARLELLERAITPPAKP